MCVIYINIHIIWARAIFFLHLSSNLKGVGQRRVNPAGPPSPSHIRRIPFISSACALTNERSRQKPSNGGDPFSSSLPNPATFSAFAPSRALFFILQHTIPCLPHRHNIDSSPLPPLSSLGFSLVLIHTGPLSLITIVATIVGILLLFGHTMGQHRLQQKTSHERRVDTLQRTRGRHPRPLDILFYIW